MPLQNRVDPCGRLAADPSRAATVMGNRGRLHDDERRVVRAQERRAWIICELEFRGRKREVMGESYTELFFLDEATALAAGHRPCFECRRGDAQRFLDLWRQELAPPDAPLAELDAALSVERRIPRSPLNEGKRTYRAELDTIPDGGMVAHDGGTWLVHDGRLRRWSFDGYGETRPIEDDDLIVDVLTPPTTVAVLEAGYRPRVHDSAG